MCYSNAKIFHIKLKKRILRGGRRKEIVSDTMWILFLAWGRNTNATIFFYQGKPQKRINRDTQKYLSRRMAVFLTKKDFTIYIITFLLCHFPCVRNRIVE